MDLTQQRARTPATAGRGVLNEMLYQFLIFEMKCSGKLNFVREFLRPNGRRFSREPQDDRGQVRIRRMPI